MLYVPESRSLLNALRDAPEARDRQLASALITLIDAWRDSYAQPAALLDSLEQAIESAPPPTDESRDRLLHIVDDLRAMARTVGGMTLNERLYAFDLFDRWDRATQDERQLLYAKVLAKP